jgi:CBS domain-containing protein
MRIADILRTKTPPDVITVVPELPLQEAIRVMVDHNVGALVVFDTALRGIISERDVLRHAATDVLRLQGARVGDLMTANVITITADTDINDVMNLMAAHNIRHLPVLANDSLIGIISIRDVVNALRVHVETENHQLHAYITGTPL